MDYSQEFLSQSMMRRLRDIEEKEKKKKKKKKKKHKKQKKQKKNVSYVKSTSKRTWMGKVDKNLNRQYDTIISTLEEYRDIIRECDRKCEKIARRRRRKGEPTYLKRMKFECRYEVLQSMYGNSILDIAVGLFNQLAPLVVIIARLVASVILAILSLDIVRLNLSDKTLDKLKWVYNKAMEIC
jgi:vacuolar-type H+-ATPase subunit I/STV1